MAGLRKTYLYKVARSGSFLGVLQNVVTPFGYSQTINSAGVQIEFDVQTFVDLQREALDPLETEAGQPLETEAGDTIFLERPQDLVGDGNSNAIIRNQNDLTVMEFSDDYPNGVTVFTGYISKWKARFGDTNVVHVTALSYGAELDNYLIEGSQTLDQSQASQDQIATLTEPGDKFAGWNRMGQSFTVGVGVTNLAAILLKLKASNVSNPQVFTLSIWNSSSDFFSGVPLATVTQTVSSTTLADYLFTLNSALTVVPGQQYFFSILASDSTGGAVAYQDTDAYAGGSIYISSYGGGSGGGGFYTPPIGSFSVPADLYFKTYYTAGATSSPFSGQDPSDILRAIIDSYHSRGGTLTYTGATIISTGTGISYTFKVNTILEGIQKILSLAPANWYWFVDPASNLIYFNIASTTANHTFIHGRHIMLLDIEATVEELKNVVYFTGGPTAGVNLFIKVSDTSSLRTNRVGLARINDNRVTASATGSAIAANYLADNLDEKYITTVTIDSSTYDINLIHVGQTVGFASFGNFVDRLLLQIVSIRRTPDQVVLGLGILPRRASSTVEAINRNLNEVNTVGNPSAPS